MANALGSLSAYTSSTWAAWDPGKLSALCWIEAALSDVSWRRGFLFPPSISVLLLRVLFNYEVVCSMPTSLVPLPSLTPFLTCPLPGSSWAAPALVTLPGSEYGLMGKAVSDPWLGLCNTLWPPAPMLRIPGPAHLQSHNALHQVLP